MSDYLEVYRDERNMIEYLAILNWLGSKYDAALERRLRTIRNGWRDWRCIRALLRRLVYALEYDTMSPQDRDRLDKRLRGGEILIRPRSAVVVEYTLAEVNQLNTVATYACKNECSICMLEGREIKKCRLRRALMQLTPPKEPEPDRFGCEFRRLAMEIVL